MKLSPPRSEAEAVSGGQPSLSRKIATPASRTVVGPLTAAFAQHFPDFDPYPWGSWDFLRTVVLNIAFAQPLVREYSDLFRGLDESELLALADSFALDSCEVRTDLAALLDRTGRG